MPRRICSRTWLSLLLIWQLLASALAHPLDMAMPAAAHPEHLHAIHHAEVIQTEMAMSGILTAQHDAVAMQDVGVKHPCKSVCKCPCGGTPALMRAAPSVAAPLPEAYIRLPQPMLAPNTVINKLLRPPIV